VDGVYLLGAVRSLSASALGPAGSSLDGRAIYWRSTQPEIASVSPEGAVEGLGLGSATLRASSEGVHSILPLEVREGIVVPAVGAPATAILANGLVELSVPVAAAPEGSVVHLRPAPSVPADDRMVAGTAFELGPAGNELALALRAGIGFDPLTIPAIERPALRLFTVVAGGGWQELPGGSVDLGNSRVSADVTRLAAIAVFRRSTPTELFKVAGDDQSAPRGTFVAITPIVQVRDAAGRPVSGITVTLSTGPGGGQLTGPANVISALDGTASVSGQWRLGSAAGTYTLIATIPGGITATFTATATP
jgi:hypothetical protein